MHNAPPGALKALQNLRVRPGGFCEMRGGLERVGPTNKADPFGTAIITCALDSPCPDIALRVWNQAAVAYTQTGPTGQWTGQILLQGSVGDFFALGSDFPFSRFQISVGQAVGAAPLTVLFEYGTVDSAPSTFAALTMTQIPDFNTAIAAAVPPNTTLDRTEIGSFAIPTNWIPTTLGFESVGNEGFMRKYWIRCRITAITGGVALRMGHAPIATDTKGYRELFVAGGDPSSSPTGGTLRAYNQDRTTGTWTTHTNLFCGGTSRSRAVSFRGVPYLVNGSDQIKYFPAATRVTSIGNPAPLGWGAPADVIVGGAGSGTWTAGLLANVAFRYAITLGYGPIRERASNLFATTNAVSAAADKNTPGFNPTLFGESPPAFMTNNSILLADANRVTINLASITNTAQADVINLYRTTEFNGTAVSAQAAYPMFLLKSIVRDATGAFPALIDDQQLAFPFPLKPLDITDSTPPPRCKHIAVHKGCLVLGSNDLYPARFWPSLPYQPDVYDRDNRFVDLTSGLAGRLMGMVEFQDHLISWTEDNMFGTSDLDTDAFQTFSIGSGLGCIAADSIVSADGYLFWLSREGVFMWDGQTAPVRISKNLSATYRKLSVESHGLTRASYHSRGYEFRTMAADGSTLSATIHRYEVDSNTWSTVLHANNGNLFPISRMVSPLGTSQFGKVLPLYAVQALPTVATGGKLYCGEQTTQDDGSAIAALMDAHFGPAGYGAFAYSRLAAYYQATDGWGIPTLSVQGANAVWQKPGQAATLAPLTGTDYSMVDATNRESQSGGQDMAYRFSVSSVANGTVNGQKLLAMYVEGTSTAPKRR